MSARRELLHVFATFAAGGPQVRAAQLWSRMGSAFRHVVLAMDGRTDARALVAGGIEVELAPAPPRGGFVATVRRQRAWIAARRPALVLTYNWGAIEAVAACRLLRQRLVHHEDGFLPDEAGRRLWRRSVARAVLLRGVPVIVPSRVLLGIVRREWHLRPERVHHLPNGVDLQRFRPADAGATPRAGAVVGSVGGLRAEKDHAMLLRAFALLPQESRLRLVGTGPLLADLQAQALELTIAPRVEFAGAVADPAPAYRAFSAFALSSRTEQMPLALLEAMASGLPVAATDVGDVRDILPPEQHAFVVPAGDHAALARALAALLADAALRARLGAANRRRVEERYDAASCLDRFTAVYEAALR
jgi:glycosyltransferase involved in cell wall biosynthesis